MTCFAVHKTTIQLLAARIYKEKKEVEHLLKIAANNNISIPTKPPSDDILKFPEFPELSLPSYEEENDYLKQIELTEKTDTTIPYFNIKKHVLIIEMTIDYAIGGLELDDVMKAFLKKNMVIVRAIFDEIVIHDGVSKKYSDLI